MNRAQARVQQLVNKLNWARVTRLHLEPNLNLKIVVRSNSNKISSFGFRIKLELKLNNIRTRLDYTLIYRIYFLMYSVCRHTSGSLNVLQKDKPKNNSEGFWLNEFETSMKRRSVPWVNCMMQEQRHGPMRHGSCKA